MTIGVAIPNAHGHDTTRTVANTVTANEIGSCATSNQKSDVLAAIPRTIGMKY